MAHIDSSNAVLDALQQRAPRAMHLGEVCARLSVGAEDRDRILDSLLDLVSRGLAKELPGRRFRAVKSPSGPGPRKKSSRKTRHGGAPVDGRLTMHPSGFGFVLPEDGGVDVFIPPPSVGGALHGDRVRVSTRPSSKGGAKGREGDVLEVLDRGASHLGGILRAAAGKRWVEPDDPRMRGPLNVSGELPQGARPGLQVLVEVIDYPSRPEEAPVVVVRDVLGEPGLTGVEVAKLKLRDGVVEPFAPDVLAEAAELPTALGPGELEGREDLRGYDLCTIDPDDARDHDDALWAERLEDGGFRVLIAIADVSHYVAEGSAIDEAALARGCTIYLPDRAIPMLPPELSSTMASLIPDQDRLTMAVEVELGPTGGIRKHRFIEGVMRSRARLTYGGVARALAMTESGDRQPEAEARKAGLSILRDVSRLLRNRRTRRGALNFEVPEARVKLDPQTNEPLDVYRSKGVPGLSEAYNLVEELMLLANEVVAAHLVNRGLPALYRVHGTPDERKLLQFTQLASALGHDIDGDDAVRPKRLAAFLRKTAGKPGSGPMNYLLLRAMQQAVYDTVNIGHFGLASEHYVHFTSPIRRYPDLVVHRVLRSVVRGEALAPDLGETLKPVAIESSRLERRAATLERDVVDLYGAILMRDRIGETFRATITGVTERGFYSAADSPFVTIFTPADALDDAYEVDELGIHLTGRRSGGCWSLGDTVRLELKQVSIERRQLIGVPVHPPKQRQETGPKPKGRGRGRKRKSGDTRSDQRNAPTGAAAKMSSRRGAKGSQGKKKAKKAKGSAARKKARGRSGQGRGR